NVLDDFFFLLTPPPPHATLFPYTTLFRSPVHGGKLVSYDEAKVAKMPGVRRVVKVNDGAVAVVADTWWRAKIALEALPIVWDEGDRKSTRLNCSHLGSSYAVFCLIDKRGS